MMKEYSLITKPYKIRIKAGKSHTLNHAITNKYVSFDSGTEFYCAKAWSPDHKNHKSLLIFNHTYLATFAEDSDAVKNKWEILEYDLMSIQEDERWKDDLAVLNASYRDFKIHTDGTVPDYDK